MMPPRSKRQPAPPTRATRSKSKAQTTGAPKQSLATEPKKAPKSGKGKALGPSTSRTRSNLIVEVVLPASKRPTPKSSSALTTPLSPAPDPAPTMPVEDNVALGVSSPLRFPSSVRESTPQLPKKNQTADLLPPSSPPPNSSPVQAPQWDHSSDPVFSTPSPSPSRSRRPSNQPSVNQATPPAADAETTHLPTPHPSSPPADELPDLAVVHSPTPAPQEDQQEEGKEYKPPTSPVPYSDTLAADDPFGFVAAEARLRERRVQLAQENPESEHGLPSSGGAHSLDHSTYEEAFASIFYDPESGTIDPSVVGSQREEIAKSSSLGSLYDSDGGQGGGGKKDTGGGKGKGKGKQKMEIVIPTRSKGKAKETSEETQPSKTRRGVKRKEAEIEASPQTKKTKRKSDERVLTTYELEAMLPHRPKRIRKPRAQEREHIALSDDGEDEPSSPPKQRKRAPVTKGKAPRKGKATARPSKPAQRVSKRVRSTETAFMDDETRERFEAEQKRRLEAYKALDGYTLEEEEVVW